MIHEGELRHWMNQLNDDSHVAIDGNNYATTALIEIAPDGSKTGRYIEIGGIPLGESGVARLLMDYDEHEQP